MKKLLLTLAVFFILAPHASAARLFTGPCELNTATTIIDDMITSGAPVSTTSARSGTYACEALNAGVSTARVWKSNYVSANGNGPIFYRIYFNFASFPNGDENFIGSVESGGTQPWTINFQQSTSKLQLKYNDVASTVGTSANAIAINTWYCLEVKFDKTGGAGAGILQGYLDASPPGSIGKCGTTQFASATNLTITNGVFAFQWGSNLEGDGITTGDVVYDDIAVNDSTGSFQTGLPGEGQVIRLKPSATGDVNAFDTQTGGTAGAGNNFTRVNEVTPDDATTFNGTATINNEDLFNMDDSGIQTYDTVNVVEVHGRFRNGTADTTGAFKFEIEKTGSGTKTQSSAIIPNSTTFRTDTTSATVKTAAITTYQDPDGAAWTKTTLDSSQAGYIDTASPAVGGRRNDITNVWELVDYAPGTAPVTSLIPRMIFMSGRMTFLSGVFLIK